MELTKCVKIKLFLGLIILGLALPAGATVPGDMAAGVPMDQVISNGMAAGQSLEAVLSQAMDAGADPCSLERAAIALKLDLSRVIKFLSDKCAADPKWAGTCTPCSLMKCAVDSGVDAVEAANALMAAGATLDAVRQCLASVGYAGADTYAYSPVTPTVPSGVGPTFPGAGGGGGTPVTGPVSASM